MCRSQNGGCGEPLAYENGDGVEQNYELAAQWYPESGGACPRPRRRWAGRNALCCLYMRGQGVPRDYVQAYLWCSLWGGEEAAAEANTAPAENQRSSPR
jgi:Sel1 repeat